MIGDRIDANLEIEAAAFGYAPLDRRSELGKVYQLFGAELPKVIEELNKELLT
jgi:type I restriction enzyme, R subunit